MNPKPFKQLLDKEEYADGAIVPCIEGTIVSLYKANNGEKDGKPYSFQKGTIKDVEGTSMEISFSNCEQPLGAKGKKVRIESFKTDSFGLQGVKVVDESYHSEKLKKDVEKRLLRITPTAQITYDGGTTAKATETTTTSSGPANYPSQKPSEIVRDILALHSAVFEQVADTYKDQTPEFQQSFIASVFIESCKQGASQHYIKRESQSTVEGESEKKVDQNNLFPADWPYAIVPGGSMKGKTLKEVPDDKLKQLFDYYEGKKDNGQFAECVYLAAIERKVASKEEEDNLP